VVQENTLKKYHCFYEIILTTIKQQLQVR